MDTFLELGHFLDIFSQYPLLVLKQANQYLYELTRIKPFLLSLSLNIVGELIIWNDILDSVTRVQTDGIVLSKPSEFSMGKVMSIKPIPEEKLTGLIT